MMLGLAPVGSAPVRQTSGLCCEHRLLASQALPAHNGDIDKAWLEFDAVTASPRFLRCDQCGAAAQKRVEYCLARQGHIEDCINTQFDRLGSRMLTQHFMGRGTGCLPRAYTTHCNGLARFFQARYYWYAAGRLCTALL